MDPLSVIASVAGVITLVAQSVELTRKFVKAAKGPAKAAKNLLHELELLSTNLNRLQQYLSAEGSNVDTRNPSSVVAVRIEHCTEQIEILNQRLSAVSSSRLKQALWPFSEAEHRDALRDLHGTSQWIQFSLSIDTAMLLSNTCEHVSQMLASQLEGIEALKSIEKQTNSIEQQVTAQTAAFQDVQEQTEMREILAWLSDHDNKQKHDEVTASRAANTGRWILNLEEFIAWNKGSAEGQLFWCQGGQGVGKTFLTSLIIDHLTREVSSDAALAYFYFDQQIEQILTPITIVGSLASQIFQRHGYIPDSVKKLFKERSVAGQPSQATVEEIFSRAHAECTDLYVILDGIDEYRIRDKRSRLVQFLRRLLEQANIHVFISSRDSPEEFIRPGHAIPILDLKAQKTDIEQFLSEHLNGDALFSSIEEISRAKIIRSMVASAQDSFLLAALHSKAVLDATSVGEMEELVESLPPTVDDVFSDTMQQIKSLPEPRKILGLRALMWLLYTPGSFSLRLADLQDCIAVRMDGINKKFRPSAGAIISCTRGLISIDRATSQPRFIHSAVRDFLRSREVDLFPDGRNTIAQICLTYLLTSPAIASICETEDEIEEKLSWPFLEYAVLCWASHVRKATSTNVWNQMLEILRSDSKRASLIQIRAYVKGYRDLYWSPEEVQSQNALHAAARFGFEEAGRDIIMNSKGLSIDATSTIGTTALIIASAGGHVNLMKVLLDVGADPLISNWYGNSLHCAAEAGQNKAIKLLVERNVGIDVLDPHGRTALTCAANSGHRRTIRLLLRLGADPRKSDLDFVLQFRPLSDDELPSLSSLSIT